MDKITLETPAQNVIPTLLKNQHTIRIKHLIYNSSGIIAYYRLPRPGVGSWITFNYFDNDDYIKVSLAPDKPDFKLGDRRDYCNVKYRCCLQKL